MNDERRSELQALQGLRDAMVLVQHERNAVITVMRCGKDNIGMQAFRHQVLIDLELLAIVEKWIEDLTNYTVERICSWPLDDEDYHVDPATRRHIRIADDVKLGAGVTFGDWVDLESRVEIDDGCDVGSRVYISKRAHLGAGVVVGDDCDVGRMALVCQDAVLDSGCHLANGTVIAGGVCVPAGHHHGMINQEVGE